MVTMQFLKNKSEIIHWSSSFYFSKWSYVPQRKNNKTCLNFKIPSNTKELTFHLRAMSAWSRPTHFLYARNVHTCINFSVHVHLPILKI